MYAEFRDMVLYVGMLLRCSEKSYTATSPVSLIDLIHTKNGEDETSLRMKLTGCLCSRSGKRIALMSGRPPDDNALLKMRLKRTKKDCGLQRQVYDIWMIEKLR